MTTIILTIIGILLAAAAALMVVFYGGDAFNSGSAGASAATIQNAGTNVTASIRIYKTEQGSFPAADWNAYLAATGAGGSYLQEAPSLPETQVQSLNANGQYVVSGIPANVCERINVNVKIGPVAPGTASTSRSLLCVPNATTGDGVFYANS